MLFKKIKHSVVFRAITILLLHAFFVSNVAFAIEKPTNYTLAVASQLWQKELKEKAALRHVEELREKYGRLGISEYTTERDIDEFRAAVGLPVGDLTSEPASGVAGWNEKTELNYTPIFKQALKQTIKSLDKQFPGQLISVYVSPFSSYSANLAMRGSDIDGLIFIAEDTTMGNLEMINEIITTRLQAAHVNVVESRIHIIFMNGLQNLKEEAERDGFYGSPREHEVRIDPLAKANELIFTGRLIHGKDLKEEPICQNKLMEQWAQILYSIHKETFNKGKREIRKELFNTFATLSTESKKIIVERKNRSLEVDNEEISDKELLRMAHELKAKENIKITSQSTLEPTSEEIVSLEKEVAKRKKKIEGEIRKEAIKEPDGGFRIAEEITDLFKDAVTQVMNAYASHYVSPDERIALLAYGSVARKEMLSCSDTDLILLCDNPRIIPQLKQLGETVKTVLEKIGLGRHPIAFHPWNTISDCVAKGHINIVDISKIGGSTFIWGDKGLYDRVRKESQRYSSESLDVLIQRFLVSDMAFTRKQRHYSADEPNLKFSRGYLRNILNRVYRWPIYKGVKKSYPTVEASLAFLRREGLITNREYQEIKEATSFFLLVRNELHIFKGRAEDVLDIESQGIIAKQLGMGRAENLMDKLKAHSENIATITDELWKKLLKYYAEQKGKKWYDKLEKAKTRMSELDIETQKTLASDVNPSIKLAATWHTKKAEILNQIWQGLEKRDFSEFSILEWDVLWALCNNPYTSSTTLEGIEKALPKAPQWRHIPAYFKRPKCDHPAFAFENMPDRRFTLGEYCRGIGIEPQIAKNCFDILERLGVVSIERLPGKPVVIARVFTQEPKKKRILRMLFKYPDITKDALASEIGMKTVAIPESEQIHAITFDDQVKLLKADEKKSLDFIAIGTSFMKGYKRGTRQYDALNPLISTLRNYCKRRDIEFTCGNPRRVYEKVRNWKRENKNARGVVLDSETSIDKLIDKLKKLNIDLETDENVFLAGVDNKNMGEELYYIRLMEMLSLTLELFRKGKINEEAIQKAHEHLGFKKKGPKRISFEPDAEPMNYEELKEIYKLQTFA